MYRAISSNIPSQFGCMSDLLIFESNFHAECSSVGWPSIIVNSRIHKCGQRSEVGLRVHIRFCGALTSVQYSEVMLLCSLYSNL